MPTFRSTERGTGFWRLSFRGQSSPPSSRRASVSRGVRAYPRRALNRRQGWSGGLFSLASCLVGRFRARLHRLGEGESRRPAPPKQDRRDRQLQWSPPRPQRHIGCTWTSHRRHRGSATSAAFYSLAVPCVLPESDVADATGVERFRCLASSSEPARLDCTVRAGVRSARFKKKSLLLEATVVVPTSEAKLYVNSPRPLQQVAATWQLERLLVDSSIRPALAFGHASRGVTGRS